MTNLDTLYTLTEKENIKVRNWYLDDCKGLFLHIDNKNAIAINHKIIESYNDEKQVLAEELGHYYMDATYLASCEDKVLIEKQEYRAKKWAYNVLIPYENLRRAILKRN